MKNIIFDMGNVLIRFEPERYIARLGLNEEDSALLMANVFKGPEWQLLDGGELVESEAIERIMQRVPERLLDEVVKLVTMWDRPIVELPGTYDLVRELKERGCGIYLLSNASTRQHDYWPRVRCSEFFDGTMISADVKLMKPDKRIFYLMLDTFGLKAEDCLFIDDHGPNVEAARSCGIKALQFRGSADEIKNEVMDFVS